MIKDSPQFKLWNLKPCGSHEPPLHPGCSGRSLERRCPARAPGFAGSPSQKADPLGFTLIELVVTIVIMGIIALVTVQYLASAAGVYTMLLAQRQADSELMDAVDRMRRESRTARSTLTATTNQWTFVNIRGLTNTVTNTFLLSGSDVMLNNNTLARGVERCQFYYYDNTNGLTTNRAAIDHVELSFKVTNNLAASEMIVNFYLREGFLK
ncbi:MAG: type II secretion system GspH family protein [Verrucomicrobia bacterium]|nr:type II secretion system GspH family protein [Verrucomicrobiota bacterium]MBU4247174.1 type II secretion system GspH family protein [Verrucomicrobiota bacterium]MBU4291244.1 type II secretion system GspH family protein [Verrucomicrobiota bacterium]MCG2678695.1 type II secretion system GspH family protein [Kiritimatiellia bacterium]